jgi:hypothetical protein
VSTQYRTAYKGNAYLDLTGAWDCGAVSGVAQTVNTTPGTTYQLTFWLGNVANDNPHRFSIVNIYLNNGLFGSFGNRHGSGNVQNWSKLKASFVAIGNTTTIAFINGSPKPDATVGLDAVSLIAQ